jgi:large subunit ribosomal protein L24
MVAKIRKGDKVIVIAGKDKGKQGEVLNVITEKNRVVIGGVNVVKRHTKPSQNSEGGIISKESSIDVSNVAHIDPKDGKATRTSVKIEKDGTKVRIAKRSGTAIDK